MLASPTELADHVENEQLQQLAAEDQYSEQQLLLGQLFVGDPKQGTDAVTADDLYDAHKGIGHDVNQNGVENSCAVAQQNGYCQRS